MNCFDRLNNWLLYAVLAVATLGGGYMGLRMMLAQPWPNPLASYHAPDQTRP